MADTRITIHLKLPRKVLASLLLSIPDDMHMRAWKDILMWHLDSYVTSANLITPPEANRILMQRGFFPAELAKEKTTEFKDKSKRSNKLVSTVLAGLEASIPKELTHE